MAGIFSYAKTLWQDGVTAITAARLNHIEQGISDAADSIKTLGDSVSRVTTFRTGLETESESCVYATCGVLTAVSARFKLKNPKNEIVALAVSMPRPVCSNQVLYARCQGKTVNAFIRESDLMLLIDLTSVDASKDDVALFGCYVAK